ncbi:alpha/beta fold hydrolase [Agaribacterium sp. ZY112]|uniref:alpha/beta fold hydrolase n=1 Tax=Agaribacterium sp. ZY112 TaxID=3233574 RepID=UPI00352432FC
MTSSTAPKPLAFVNSLKQALPKFSPLSVFAELPSGLSADLPSGLSSALLEYFSFYEFDGLFAGQGLVDRYDFGSIQAGAYQLACHYWAVDQARAEVVICHGLFDHVALYQPLIRYLLSQRINVLAFDLPEHGLSSGGFGQLDDFSLYHQTLEALLEHFPKGELARIALGQSTGAAVWSGPLLQKTPLAVDAAIFLAPLLKVRAWKKIQCANYVLRPWLKKIRRSFTSNSHDPDFVDFLCHKDPLQVRYISTSWIAAMLRWPAVFMALPASSIPLFLVQGTGDKTVDFDYNLPCFKQKFLNAQVMILEGARHHLTREAAPWQEPMFTAIGSYLDDFLGAQQPAKSES